MSWHLDERFPDVSLIIAFSIFNLSEMPQNSSADLPQFLIDKVHDLTEHYRPCNVISLEVHSWNIGYLWPLQYQIRISRMS